MLILAVRRNNIKNQSQKPNRSSLYSMESGTDTIRSRRSHRSSRDHIQDDDDNEDDLHGQQPHLSPKPMTPRRVKRRSVMTRGTSNHNVTGESSSNRSSRRHSNGRNSTRSSRRKLQHQNPVTKLMDQQASSSHHRGDGNAHSRYPHMIPSLTASNLKSLNQSADPIYYNMNSSSPLLTTSHSTMTIQQQQHQQHIGPYQSVPPPVGHYNPTYQHSTPNLMSTNSQELIDELYHRPPSVRSSYSNFHGARSVYALNNLAAGGAAGAEPPIPQVPQRRPAITGGSSGAGTSGAAAGPGTVSGRVPTDLINNDRSMAFMSSAPPAYNYLNYHTPPDSETTM